MDTLVIRQSGKWPEKSQAREVVSRMIQSEYQFEIIAPEGNCLISFYKGTFQLLVKFEDKLIEVQDTPKVTDQRTMDGAFVQTKLDFYIAKNIDDNRYAPAEAICDYLEFKIKLNKASEVKINVLQPGRNGFIEGGQLILERKDW